MEMSLIVQLASTLGPTGVLAWYCYYVTSKTIPRLVAEFRAETRLARADAKEERQHFDATLVKISDAQDKRIEKVTKVLDRTLNLTQGEDP